MTEIWAALVAGVFGLLATGLGLLGRRQSKSAVRVRQSLDRQEALENYAFTLRRQVISTGRRPHAWPEKLRYLRRDDPDEGDAEDE